MFVRVRIKKLLTYIILETQKECVKDDMDGMSLVCTLKEQCSGICELVKRPHIGKNV